MAHPLNGTWILESSEDYDGFMKELGVGFIQRKMLNSAVPTLIIKNEGIKWSIKLRSSVKNKDDDFILNEEFDDETIDDRRVATLFYMSGETLFFEQRDRVNSDFIISGSREVGPDGRMTETLKCRSITAIRTFKRVEN